MKIKKFMALAMAGVMTIAMGLTAFAAEGDYGEAKPVTGEIISKAVNWEKGSVELPNETFTFSFAQVENGDKEPARINADIPKVTISFTKDNEPNVAVTSAIDVSGITKPGVYTYDVTEVAGDTAGMTYNKGNKTYQLKVFAKYDANNTLQKYFYFKDGEEKVFEANFENEYSVTAADLTIKKEVTNPEWATVDKYAFTITFAESAIDSVNPDGYAITGAMDENGTAIERIKDGDTFYLGDQQTATITGVPAGIKYSLTEVTDGIENFDKFVVSQVVNGGDPADLDENTDVGETALGEKTNSVVYKNTFKEPPTPAGLAISVAPFIAMFAAVGAAIALYVAAKRRVR